MNNDMDGSEKLLIYFPAEDRHPDFQTLHSLLNEDTR